jgi:hypothetical protein
MAKQFKSVLNPETGENDLIEMSAKDIAQFESERKESLDRINQYAANVESKKNLLIKLGITEDEAKLLLG